MQKKIVIIGAGPGGYAAALYAADKGFSVTVIDQDKKLGGVCLARGCIPSKILLHIAHLISQARSAKDLGVSFTDPEIDLEKILAFKNRITTTLSNGLAQLMKQRKIDVIQGRASFLTPDTIAVFRLDGGHDEIPFEKAIIATGSLPMGLPFAPPSEKIWDSTSALEIPRIPENLLVVGGGYIGMELATVYHALGCKITMVEMTPSLLPGADRDLTAIIHKHAKALFTAIHLNTRITAITENGNTLSVDFATADGKTTREEFSNVLIAIGRKNVFDGLGLANTGVQLTDDKKFIVVDAQRRTTDPNIYAIGDISGQPMLAHKASAEAKVAVEAISGQKTEFCPKAIPAVVFTDPELAWCGLTQAEAEEQGLAVRISKFPWAASGRALTLNRTDGLTKIIADATTNRVLGVAIAGPGAGELIAEGVLAVEMGMRAQDMAVSIHPHPTLSETLMEAAEGIFGSPTHIYHKQ